MLTILLGLLLWAPQTGQVQQYLQNGLAAEQAGHYEQALGIWAGARETLPAPSLAIARQYIRLATEQTLRGYYEKASEMYFWGLSGDQFNLDSDVLATEIEFLEPLAGNKRARAWKKMIDKEQGQVYDQITAFWRMLDTTPLTAHNERLIEHWERISYAREKFENNSATVYDTDDRGVYYIKYGKPSRIEKGLLKFETGKARSWIQQIVSRGLTNPRLAYTSEFNRFLEEYIRKTKDFHNYPNYEIWIYENLRNSSDESTLFIFGSGSNSDNYKIVEAIDDFIPGRAMSSARVQLPSSPLLNAQSNNTTIQTLHRSVAIRNLRPGLILQMMYYDELSYVHHYFGTRAIRIESEALNPGVVSSGLAKRMSYEHKNDMLEMRISAPVEESTYNKSVQQIPLDIRQYRLLDASNRPVLATLVETRPQTALLDDYIRNYPGGRINDIDDPARLENLDQYRLRVGADVFAPDGRPAGSLRATAGLVTGKDKVSRTLLMVPHASEGAAQLVAAELYNTDPAATRGSFGPPFADSLRGAGKRVVDQPEPLNSDPGTLEMGDIILGYGQRDSESNTFLPFRVAPGEQIPSGESLMLHLEVYHLEPGPNGIAAFTLDYEILPVGRLGWTKEKQGQYQLRLNLQQQGPRWAEDLEIQTKDLEEGRYVLRLNVNDTHNGQQMAREVHFMITQNE